MTFADKVILVRGGFEDDNLDVREGTLNYQIYFYLEMIRKRESRWHFLIMTECCILEWAKTASLKHRHEMETRR